ncbi:MAG: hypothetical protein QM648_11155 [Solirubrobacterales bacterium]
MDEQRATSRTRAAFRRLVREEHGFTLAELLSAQIVAGVVLAAAGMLVIISLRSEQQVSDRVNALSIGRTMGDQIQQRLNSQVCLYPGEYMVNGATATASAASIVYAGADGIMYFADISSGVSAGSTTGVGFNPYLRYLIAPTAGSGRYAGFIDAFRPSTPSTNGATAGIGIPYKFTFASSSGNIDDLDSLANDPTATVTMPPTSILSRMGVGVTNATATGSTGATLPYFQYYTTDNIGPTGVPITLTNGVVPSTQISTIGKIRVNYKILGQSGFDGTNKYSASGARLDDRTESFSQDIFLRTSPDICDQMGRG